MVTRIERSEGFWAALLQWSRIGVQAIVFLVMARFLTLPEIGAFGMAAAPLRFLQVLHKSGIEDATVIATGPDHDPGLTALAVVSWAFSGAIITFCCLMALVIHLTVPEGDQVAAMMAAIALTSLFHGVAAVPDGLLRRRRAFRGLALRSLASQGAGAILAVLALWMGAGAWSLVLFTVANALIGAALSLRMSRWHPDLAIGFGHQLRPAVVGSLTISGRVLVGAAVLPILQVALGAFAGLAASGAFQIATRVIGLLDALTFAPLRALALPRFSALRDRPMELQSATLSALGMAAATSAWVYLGVFCVADVVLVLLVGSANAEATTFALRAFCLAGLGQAAAAVINQALLATGAAGAALRLSGVQLCLGLGLALPFAGHSASAVALACALASTLMMAVLLWALKRRLGIAVHMALGQLLWPYMAGALMAGAVLLAGYMAGSRLHPALLIAGQVIGGTIIYLGALSVLAPDVPRAFGLRRFR
jgi:O-antigen/teichoic acid export membrane protein